MKNISKHITYYEATYSYVALKHGITNVPNDKQLENMRILAEAVFEPLREFCGVPIAVTSFFRSRRLNSKLKGSKSSQHMANNGAAIDIDADIYGKITNLDIFYYIKENLEFDQLIAEFPNSDGQPSWVHVSYKAGANRKQVFTAYLNKNGKTEYIQQNQR